MGPVVRCEVVAVGTELLLGQVVDTNSAWLGERLALAGIDSHFRTAVGDNHERIVAALRAALSRSDAVIVCGGLGPTQDDITREALAEVMGAPLVRHGEQVERIRALFRARGREMAESNARQADVPAGATMLANHRGTAPGLACPVGAKVVYAVPGVPHEMQAMAEEEVIPALQVRAGSPAVILSRTLRTWGMAESALAELVAPRVDALAAAVAGGAPEAVGATPVPTLAFLASGMEGMKLRVTVKAASAAEANSVLDAEEAELRGLLGDAVFGVDDQGMEQAVGDLLIERGLGLGLAESMTGGLLASRLTAVPGASAWFRGSVVAYSSSVKFDLLGVPEGPVVTGEAAMAMAVGAVRALGADVGLSITGVAGPGRQEEVEVGTVFVGLCLGGAVEATRLRLPGDRERVRQFAAVTALDLLRRRLLSG